MALSKMIENSYQQLLKNPADFKLQGTKLLVVDDFTLAYLNITQTKERLARDELSATTRINKFGKYIYSPNITAVVYV